MIDPLHNPAEENEAERRRRLLQEQVEQRLLQEDEDESLAQQQQQQRDQDDEHQRNNNNLQDPNLLPPQEQHGALNPPVAAAARKAPWLDYCNVSFLFAWGLLYYALRTRPQWYLALVYLSSSKWALVVMGNACVALAISVFKRIIDLFLNGLRLAEAEGIQDFFKWNVTETCLALTIFRSELDVSTAVQFLVLVWLKSLHHVAVLRENHTRLTQEIVVAKEAEPTMQANNNHNNQDWEEEHHNINIQPSWGSVLLPVRIPWVHIKLLALLIMLQWMDSMVVHVTTMSILDHGPSVNILFAFEAAILLVSAWSHVLLWQLHALDGLLHVLGSEQGVTKRVLLPLWKEYKATLIFAVELQAQAVQFLFYVTFFGIVMTYYGVPINLFREVYISFSAFKARLVAFVKYRRLMASMDRFENVTDEKLDETGRTCIICRDDMTVTDCKQLPVCQHLFHKSCLREWLVQQQSCPTCRSDIAAMEAQERTRRAADEAAEERRRQENETIGNEEEEIVFEPDHETEQDDDNIPDAGQEPPLRDEREETVASPLEFPALYRVCVPSTGAVVYGDLRGDIKRIIPYGMLVLCLEEANRQGRSCLRLPDGWIEKRTVQRLHAISAHETKKEN